MFKKSDVIEFEVLSVSLTQTLLPLRALSHIHLPLLDCPGTPMGWVGPWFNHGLCSGKKLLKIRKRGSSRCPAITNLCDYVSDCVHFCVCEI